MVCHVMSIYGLSRDSHVMVCYVMFLTFLADTGGIVEALRGTVVPLSTWYHFITPLWTVKSTLTITTCTQIGYCYRMIGKRWSKRNIFCPFPEDPSKSGGPKLCCNIYPCPRLVGCCCTPHYSNTGPDKAGDRL